MSANSVALSVMLRSYETVVSALIVLVSEVKGGRTDMKQLQEQISNLSKDVELMKGGVPEDASLHLVASQLKVEMEHMEDWLVRNGPRHPGQHEVVVLRSNLRHAKTLVERIVGINKQREGLDADQTELGINKAEEGEPEAKEVPDPEAARGQEVEELVTSNEETENDMVESQEKGWHQEKVGE